MGEPLSVSIDTFRAVGVLILVSLILLSAVRGVEAEEPNQEIVPFSLQGGAGGSALRDPTAPLGRIAVKTPGKKKSPATLRLSAIYFRAGRYTAIINGRALNVGDSVKEKTIKIIEKNSVTFDGEGVSSIFLYPQVVVNKRVEAVQ